MRDFHRDLRKYGEFSDRITELESHIHQICEGEYSGDLYRLLSDVTSDFYILVTKSTLDYEHWRGCYVTIYNKEPTIQEFQHKVKLAIDQTEELLTPTMLLSSTLPSYISAVDSLRDLLQILRQHNDSIPSYFEDPYPSGELYCSL